MTKCAIYGRVSTSDQHVETQLYPLRELAARRGFEVVHEYTDVGVSGSKARRKGLDAMLADAHRRRFSIVLVAAFDRDQNNGKLTTMGISQHGIQPFTPGFGPGDADIRILVDNLEAATGGQLA